MGLDARLLEGIGGQRTCIRAKASATRQGIEALPTVVAEVNREHDLEYLCRELPTRAQQVKDEKGGASLSDVYRRESPSWTALNAPKTKGH